MVHLSFSFLKRTCRYVDIRRSGRLTVPRGRAPTTFVAHTHKDTLACAHIHTRSLSVTAFESWYAPCLCRHPDKNQEDTKEKFQEINEAYQCLQKPSSMEADSEDGGDGGSSYPVFVLRSFCSHHVCCSEIWAKEQ
jgi:hypothetical protein